MRGDERRRRGSSPVIPAERSESRAQERRARRMRFWIPDSGFAASGTTRFEDPFGRSKSASVDQSMPRSDLLRFYLSPEGRVSRQAYWFRLFLPVLGLNLALAALEGRLAAGAGGSLASLLLNLALAPPFFIVTYKRFKDRAFGPRHFLWFLGVTAAAIAVGNRAVAAEAGTLAMAAFTVLAMVIPAFLYLVLALPSIPGETRFGPDPRGV